MTIEDVMEAVESRTGQKVKPETKIDDLGLDSLEFLDLILFISNGYGYIPDQAAYKIDTVNDLFLQASKQPR